MYHSLEETEKYYSPPQYKSTALIVRKPLLYTSPVSVQITAFPSATLYFVLQ